MFADEDDEGEEAEEDDEDAEEEREEDQKQDGRRRNSTHDEDEHPAGVNLESAAPQSATKSLVSPPAAIPLPEPETVTPDIQKRTGKAVPPKRGFMARSMVIDHSQEGKEAEIEGSDAKTRRTELNEEFAAGKACSVSNAETAIDRVSSPPPPSLKNPETGGIAPGERRKSVTFNPQTRVRLYEKGEVMPSVSNAASSLDTPNVGSRFELLPDEQGAKAVKDSSTAPVSDGKKPATPAAGTKSKDSGTFSGFKKGFLDNGPSKKQIGKTNQHTPVVSPPPASAVTVNSPTPSASQPTVVESPEYHQPLAPAHEKPPATKRQSLFAQRKAEAQSKREQLFNFSSFDPMPSAPVGTGAVTPAQAKAPPVPNTMKMAVVERPVMAVARAPEKPKPAVGPIPTEPSPQQFPPSVKKVHAAPEVRPEDGSAVEGRKQMALQATVMERKPAAVASESETSSGMCKGIDHDSRLPLSTQLDRIPLNRTTRTLTASPTLSTLTGKTHSTWTKRCSHGKRPWRITQSEVLWGARD